MYPTIHQRLADAMKAAHIHALLLVDPENLGYVSGALLPFVRQTPDRAVLAVLTRDACALFLPPDLAQAAADQQPAARCVAVPETVPGPRTLVQALASDALSRDWNGQNGQTLGVDMQQMPASWLEPLRAAFPSCRLTDAGPLLREARRVKLAQEIDSIEMACRQADTGIIGAINHMEGAHVGGAYHEGCYTVAEFVERMRVHAYEGGTSLSGHMGAFFGPDAALYRPQSGFLPREGLVRIEYDCCHGGYWSVNARMMSMGSPSAADSEACAANLLLKNTALERLQAGIACCDIQAAVEAEALRRGIALLGANGIGYGVGRSEREAPFICAQSSDILAENMVVALDIVTLSPRSGLIRSVDIYAVTAAEPRLLSWFRNWDKPYAITGFRNAH